MRIKLRVVLALVLVAITLGYWLLRSDKFDRQGFVQKEKSVTMQFIPSPIIINGTQKDDRLYELLLNQKEGQVNLANVDLDIEQIFIATPVFLKNLSMHFKYDKETNKVEFQGNSNGSRKVKISGYYELTSKNNIRYYIDIKDKYKSWIIDSIYAPAYLDNELEYKEIVTGKFSFQAPDLLKAIYGFDHGGLLPGEAVSITGGFTKQDNFLEVKDLYLKVNAVEASLCAKIKDKNILIDVALNKIDLDKILKYLPFGEADRIFSLMLRKVSGFTVSGTFNCDKVTVNGLDLRSLLIVLSGRAQSKNNIEISELKFSMPDKSEFNSSGRIFTMASGIAVDGSFSIPNVKASSLAKLLDLGDYSSDSLVSLSSGFELIPTKVTFKNFIMKEGPMAATGKLSLSKYISSKILTGNMEVSNYSTNSNFLMQYMLHKNHLLSGTHDLDYEAALLSNKKENFLKDINLQFSDLKTTGGIVKKISIRYIESPNSIELEDFKSEDPKFNLQGSLKFSSGKPVPNLSMKFEGDKVDMNIFNDLIVRPLIYKTGHDDNNMTVFSYPKFNLATGDIKLNLKNPDKKSYVSDVNCTAQLKEQSLSLNDCSVKLFDGQTYLNGKIDLGKILGYDISFSNKNVNMYKLTRYLIGEDKKIKATGEAHINGSLKASGFNTMDEMVNALAGRFRIKSESVGATYISLKSFAFKYGTIKNMAQKESKQETEFHNINGEFALASGKLQSKKLSFITRENIHGETNFVYKLSDKNMNGILSLAYFDRVGKIDGFNVTFYGDIKKLKTKLGTHIDKP